VATHGSQQLLEYHGSADSALPFTGGQGYWVYLFQSVTVAVDATGVESKGTVNITQREEEPDWATILQRCRSPA